MPIALLVILSLFALVVTSRPILPSDADLGDWAHIPSTFQTSVQAALRAHPDKDDLISNAACFHFPEQGDRTQCLSELAMQTATAKEVFEKPSAEPSLDILTDVSTEGQDMLGSEGGRDEAHPVALESVVVQNSPIDGSPSAPVVVLVASCVAALLGLVCVVLTLYIIKSFRSELLASKTIWSLLPNVWKRTESEGNVTATTQPRALQRGCLLLQVDCFTNAEEGFARGHDPFTGDKPLYYDAVSDIESEWDDVDEKYQDALDVTPLPLVHDLPLEESVSYPSHFSHPSSLTFSHPYDQSTPDRNTLLMRDLSSPVTRPACSACAIDSPPLDSSSRQVDIDVTPQLLIQSHRRAYRSPVPEFDIALAMQLRPGHGISADSTWMVRFLMTMFGWFAVALTGNAR